MADVLTKILAYLRGMWRFRWYALAISWVTAMVGWYFVYAMPDQYEARAQVYVDTDSVLRPLLSGISRESDVMSEVELMTRALLSRPNLLSVAQKTDLDLRAGTDSEMDALIDRMRSKLVIKSVGRGLYTISFRDFEPQMTRDVVQTLLGSFVSDTLKEGRDKSSEAVLFLENQIRDYEKRLAAAEQRLADFKKENVGLMPGETGSFYDRLDSAMARKRAIESMIALKTSTRNELRGQIEGEEPTFGLLGPQQQSSGPVGSSFDATIADIESQLTALRVQFTDKHPDVAALLERLESVEAQRDEEVAARAPVGDDTGGATATTYNPLDLNPVYQQMRMSLSNVEVELTELRTQLRQQNSIITNLKRAVDTVPEVEARLSALNRDYTVTKGRYEELLQRLENARIGERAESSVSDVRFRVIEPPRTPLEPYGPNRAAFLTVTLLAALGAGIGLSFLLDQLRPVFITRDDLAQRSGLPVLGSISVVMMPHQRFMMRVQKAAFLAGLLGLVAIFGVVVAFEEPFLEFFRSAGLGGAA